jgi:hypothetical protein
MGRSNRVLAYLRCLHIESPCQLAAPGSNPPALNLAETHLTRAPVVDLRGFDFGVPRHAPGDETAAIRRAVPPALHVRGRVVHRGMRP